MSISSVSWIHAGVSNSTGINNTSATTYTSVFTQGGSLNQEAAGVSLSVSPAAKLMAEIEAVSEKLDKYSKAISNGDLSVSAASLAALKQEITNFKVAVQNMEAQFDIIDQMMDTIDKMLKKVQTLEKA